MENFTNLVDIEAMHQMVQKERKHNELKRYIMTFVAAIIVSFLGIIVDIFFQIETVDIIAYTQSVSTGIIAAGITYWLVDRDYEDKKIKVEKGERLYRLTSRLQHVAQEQRSRNTTLESNRRRIDYFNKWVAKSEGRKQLRFEYMSWTLQATTLLELAQLKQLTNEKIDLVNQLRNEILQLSLHEEVDRLNVVIQQFQNELDEFKRIEDTMETDVIDMTLDFNERFVKSDDTDTNS